MLTEEKKTILIMHAKQAAGFSYSPYSGFRVGAALLCSDDSIILGTNVENRSYGLTNCAERSAFFTAVSAGKREFLALAVFSPDHNKPLPPCGACRQVISEFTGMNFPVIMAGTDNVIEKSIGELLPCDALHEFKDKMHG